jgi:ribosomal protein S18 acetylase RimI-like enzyme
MNRALTIENTTTADLPFVYELFDLSIIYQEKKGYPVWKNYDKSTLVKDVNNKNQYKIVINEQIAMVYSVCYSDKILWRQMENGDAIYLHRIVVNPKFKGQRLFGHILEWSVQHAKSKHLKFIRMDTWADDGNIINYYKGFGFTFIEDFNTPDIPELPVHNRNIPLALLEFEV